MGNIKRNPSDGFDSALEKSVYRLLCQHFPQSNIHLHCPITIRPQTPHFEPRTWKVDFALALGHRDDPLFHETIYALVEAKGKWLLRPHAGVHFRLLLEQLSQNNPELFDKLLIVGNDNFKSAGIAIHDYRNALPWLKAHLMSKSNVKHR